MVTDGSILYNSNNIMVAQNGGYGKGFEDFVISDYLHLLDKGTGKNRGYYLCPNCNKYKLSINRIDGKKYDCFSCKETSAIASVLVKEVRDLQEKEGKKNRPKNTKPIHHYYTDENGKQIIRVVRTYGNGGKQIRQQSLKDGKWKYGLHGVQQKDAALYRYDKVKSALTKAAASPNAKGETIHIAEGETCVEELEKLGFTATTNLGGSGKNYHAYEVLKDYPNVIIYPDRDKPGVKHLDALLERLPQAKICYFNPDSPLWNIPLPDQGGSDIADWIYEMRSQRMSDQKIKAKILSSVVSQKREVIVREKAEANGKKSKSSTHKRFQRDDGWESFYQLLQDEYSGRLRYNEFTFNVELDGKPAKLDSIHIQVRVEHGINIAANLAYDTAVYFAQQDSYHPIKDYLEGLHKTAKEIDIQSLSSCFFGTDDPLYDRMVYITLIGAIARIYQPGCKFDTVLVLQGKQGIGKSTFFNKLFGDEYFTDCAVADGSKDDLLIIHQFWCNELAELDWITSRHAAGKIKAFSARRTDSFRRPYGRTIESNPRTSILVGSVNKSEYLIDETGNRRFLNIPVQCKIDTNAIAKERDNIWYSALLAYQAKENWYLTYEEERKSEEKNVDHVISDAWDNADLDAWLLNRPYFTTTFILVNFFEVVPPTQKRDEMRITKILTQKGYKKDLLTVNKKRDRYWFLPS